MLLFECLRQDDAEQPRQDAAAGSARRGVTLVELLIVVTILLMLLGVGVPMMKPAIEQGRVREAARQVNAFCALAKARAVEMGRPAGVWLERSDAGSNACLDLFLAEVPPTYSGDFEGATVNFGPLQLGPQDVLWIADQRTPVGFSQSDTLVAMPNVENTVVYSSALIQPGETFWMRFNFKGPLYPVTRGPIPNTPVNHPAMFALDPLFVPPTGARFPDLLPGETGVPFQIFRAPVRTASRAVQLSGGAIVDLGNSGYGLDGLQFRATQITGSSPVVIMFYPGGGVERIVADRSLQFPTGTIHLLLGTTGGLDLAESTPEAPNPLPYSPVDDRLVDYNQNLVEGESVWVSIGHRTGMITSSENAWEARPVVDPPNPFFLSSLRTAREFAQTAQTLGGQ